MRATFFGGEPAPHSGLEYVLQRFYSSTRFRYESVFTEIFLKRIKGKRVGFAPCGRGPGIPKSYIVPFCFKHVEN